MLEKSPSDGRLFFYGLFLLALLAGVYFFGSTVAVVYLMVEFGLLIIILLGRLLSE